MRVRLNRSLKTKPKTQDDASCQNTEEKTNKETKNTMAPDNTELTIQIIFAAAVVAAHLLSFYTLHIEALTLLFKCLTNFPKERNHKEQRGQTPLHSKTSKSERRLRNWKEKEHVLMEVHKMHGQAGPHYPGSHGPRRQHSKTQPPR